MLEAEASGYILERTLGIRRDAAASVMEDDAAAVPCRRRDHRGGRESTVGDIAMNPPQLHPLIQSIGERRGIEQAPQVRPGHAEELAHRAESLGELGPGEQR